MGFLSGLTGSQKTNVPASGFYSQPAGYQKLYNTVLDNTNAGIGNVNASMFSPMDITADEQNAFNAYRQGFTPTEESMKRDIGMLMNPFDEFVLNDINRAANSDYSILKQDLSAAGQLGSNRQRLGANDIEQTRLGTIGKQRQQAYNTALDALFNNIIPQRQKDAAGLLGIGDFERNLKSQQNLAPVQAIQAQQGLLGGIPTEFGNFGTPAQTIKTGGGLGGLLGGLGAMQSLGGGLGSLFGSGVASATGLPWLASAGLGSQLGGLTSLLALSDIRLKENIKEIGTENGFPIYEFNYVWDKQKYKGVMAQDVEEIMPEAVQEIAGYKAVDYGMIGVSMEAI